MERREPLRANPETTRAWQQRSRAPLERTGGLRRTGGPARRQRPRERKSAPDPVTPAVRREVEERSRGMCEVRASRRCRGRAQHKHHRKLRRHGDHRAVNLLDVCLACHDEIHGPALADGRSYRNGWLVRSAHDPEAVPVSGLAGWTSWVVEWTNRHKGTGG